MVSSRDIIWAAGIFEGEGSIVNRIAQRTTQVSISQSDTWLVNKFKQLFGGTIQEIRRHDKNPKHKDCYYWIIYGSRAIGFIETIYQFLSPRRQAKVREAIRVWRPAKNRLNFRKTNGQFNKYV